MEKLKQINVIKYENENSDLREKLKSVNYHLIKACNYRCKFCFAHFNQIEKNKLTKNDAKNIINELSNFGTKKITFVGGEPTLVEFLPDLVKYAKDKGMTTMVVTNGTKLNEQYLKKFENKLDWVGLSIDSGREQINKELGRGNGNHVSQTLDNVKLLRKYNIRVKLNTVVTKLSYDEDMSWLIKKIKPERWKVFKLLMIKGENDAAKYLTISDKEFNSFIEKHEKCDPIMENNDDMTNSYVMIDPEGRFFSNSNGKLNHGPPILAVGVEKAFKITEFNIAKFESRGGDYDW